MNYPATCSGVVHFYNITIEQHPLEGEIMIAAIILSEIIKLYNIPKEESPISIRETLTPHRIPGTIGLREPRNTKPM